MTDLEKAFVTIWHKIFEDMIFATRNNQREARIGLERCLDALMYAYPDWTKLAMDPETVKNLNCLLPHQSNNVRNT